MIAGCISAKTIRGLGRKKYLLLHGSGVSMAFLRVREQGRERGRKLESGALFLLELSLGVPILSHVYSLLGTIKHEIRN